MGARLRRSRRTVLTGHNLTQAARLLGVRRTTLYSRMQHFQTCDTSGWIMYYTSFDFASHRFGITPYADIFEGARRGAIVEALLYGVAQADGILKVTGETGTGKTMLCRVSKRACQQARRAYIWPIPTCRRAMMHAIVQALGLAADPTQIPPPPHAHLAPLPGTRDPGGDPGRGGAEHARAHAGCHPPARQPRGRTAESAADRAGRAAGIG
ncbi:MAG: hypothetical protein KIS79_03270 [Burkholderiales bacterium]|nr:hypothetical protein [Burkholderiales bacterium]